MAVARITHTWPDGTRDHMTIEVEPSYPDAIDEARVQVTRMYREVCNIDEDVEE